MNQPLIQLKGVSKSFDANHVLQGVDLSIYRGEITTIIGKSGVGKSVLLKHMIGLMAPDSGTILFMGKPFSKMKAGERKVLKQKFSYMFQGTALFDSMTVFENIALPLMERTALKTDKIRERVAARMQQLDLGDIGREYPSQLSGGMKKRVALARALVTDPEIVLFDEPTTGLDPIRKNAVHSMIAEYQKKFGFTGVMVSHDIPDIFFISQRIAMLHEGRILFEGGPAEIQNISDPLIQEFIRGFELRHDNLTGLIPPTREIERFQEAMNCLQDTQVGFSLVMFSIEDLGRINETFGHAAGQTLIKNFAAILQQHLRITDICARHGMDKIMLILPNTTIAQARMLCEKLAVEIKAADVMNGQPYQGLCFSVRAGLAGAENGSPLESIVAALDAAPNLVYDFKVC
ncbi:MAG: ATP-binding cassette domain-containing protein [Thermodesulfobacteriota bacterium]